MKKTDKEIKTNDTKLIIEEDKAGQRIDKVLSSHPLIASRTQAADLISQNLVLYKDKPVKPSQKTVVGDEFLVRIPILDTGETVEPYDFPLDIIYEDEDLLVVNKPTGLVVHPAHGHYQDTLVNALVHYTNDLAMGFNEKRPGIVHRLDKETSGLLVVAKNNFAHEHLAQQFKQRTIHRIYWAMVFGDIKESQGRMETLIARHPKNRKRFSSQVAQGKIAITNFKKLKSSIKGFSLLELKLETGRTHQIRVHLADKGFPVVGDVLYGSDKRVQSVSSKKTKELILNLNRIALHAKELGFVHPKTQEEMRFTSDLPDDLMGLYDECAFK